VQLKTRMGWRGLVLGSLVSAVAGMTACQDPPAAEVAVDDPGKQHGPLVADAAPPPDAAPELVELRLLPAGRLALATGEEVPLRVTAAFADGGEREVTAEVDFAVRNGAAGSVRGGAFVAGDLGSQATTVVARWRGRDSAPLLVSTLTPQWRESFAAPREVWLAGTGYAGAADTTGGALRLAIDGKAGDRFQIALPFAAPQSLTNAERLLFSWRFEGAGAFQVAGGSQNGADYLFAVDAPQIALGAEARPHASIPLNPSFYDFSSEARSVVLDVTLAAASKGALVIDDVRVVRQLILGVNLAWLDGAFGHDFGHDPRHPDWGVAYDPDHIDALLGFAEAAGVRLLRVWVFESCEGLMFDAGGVTTGIDPTFLANFDDFVRRRVPAHDVKLYLTLLAAQSLADCPAAPVLPAGPARDELFARALRPFVARYGDSPWVWGIDLMNEPEAAVGGSTGNWGDGTSWDVMRDFLAAGARLVREAAPGVAVSAGSGWHGEANVRDGRFSGLGFSHLDWHAYADDGALPSYASLGRHARVLLGEGGQAGEAYDDALLAAVLRRMLSDAATQGYWGILPWYLDHPGSRDHLTLLDPASSYEALRGRPALDEIRKFAASRGDIGP
jgi:hypothetical protein